MTRRALVICVTRRGHRFACLYPRAALEACAVSPLTPAPSIPTSQLTAILSAWEMFADRHSEKGRTDIAMGYRLCAEHLRAVVEQAERDERELTDPERLMPTQRDGEA